MKIHIKFKGGPGSGHFGHAGRPGKVGGSISGISSGFDATMDAKKAVADRIGNGVKPDDISNSLAITNANMNVSKNTLISLYYGVREPYDEAPTPPIKEEPDRIFALFEETNPDNTANPVVVTHIGGTKKFFEQFDWILSDYADRTEWDPERGEGGGITFLDPYTGKEFYVETSKASGWDWFGGN